MFQVTLPHTKCQILVDFHTTAKQANNQPNEQNQNKTALAHEKTVDDQKQI